MDEQHPHRRRLASQNGQFSIDFLAERHASSPTSRRTKSRIRTRAKEEEETSTESEKVGAMMLMDSHATRERERERKKERKKTKWPAPAEWRHLLRQQVASATQETRGGTAQPTATNQQISNSSSTRDVNGAKMNVALFGVLARATELKVVT
ncbi:hypothetical protein OUZ56_003816 [Daphnia magna]|uniref:Uncharacterized protein n=1 Tax=Daphnia magna TaxID=35525 RepID=A0ABQ9YMW3_9CRUS|nr:hypothetical protein OUZ56_003816 [Daphnia magna]